MKNLPKTLLSLAACLVAFSQAPAAMADSAAPSVQGDDGQFRINYSGKLRMLSQRIPAAACHLANDVDPDGALKLLTSAVAEFEQIITALEFGNDEVLSIGAPEERRMTLQRVHELRERWEPLKAAAEGLIADPGSVENASFVLTNNIEVLKSAQLLVEELVQQYSNPNGTTQAMLFLIDISGRQRMLTQKVSKESCLLGGPLATESTLPDLEGTIGIFEASLEALRFGMPAVGVNPPPNATILDGLNGVLADWQEVTPLLDQIRAGQSLAAQQHAEKFQELNVVMANMNKVVGMYTEAATN